MASFSLAVNRKTSSGKQQTLWVCVNCWGNLSSVAQQCVEKGSLLQSPAEFLRPSAWISRDDSPQASIYSDDNPGDIPF